MTSNREKRYSLWATLSVFLLFSFLSSTFFPLFEETFHLFLYLCGVGSDDFA